MTDTTTPNPTREEAVARVIHDCPGILPAVVDIPSLARQIIASLSCWEIPEGYRLVPVEPLPATIAAIAVQVDPPTTGDYEVARQAEKLLPRLPITAPGVLEVPDILAEIVRDYRAALSASPQPSRESAEEEKGSPRLTLEMVEEAMLDTWSDICADTGCHPLDIRQMSRRVLEYQPGHWTRAIAGRLQSALSTQPHETDPQHRSVEP